MQMPSSGHRFWFLYLRSKDWLSVAPEKLGGRATERVVLVLKASSADLERVISLEIPNSVRTLFAVQLNSLKSVK